MLDPKLVRTDPEKVAQNLKTRNFTLDVAALQALEEKRKRVQTRTEDLQRDRNARSKAIGKAKAQGEDIQSILDSVESLGADLKSAEEELGEIQQETSDLMLTLPNMVDESVPPGKDEDDNELVRSVGEIPQFTFSPKDHVDLTEGGNSLDFETGAQLAGSRFVVMRGDMARLHRALAQFMLDTHTAEHGYTEINVPHMVNAQTLQGTGQLPKFEEDLFRVEGENRYYMIPTSEVPVTNVVAWRLNPYRKSTPAIACVFAPKRALMGAIRVA